jgi:hypothetical protein
MAKRQWFLSSGLVAIALIFNLALAAQTAPPIDTAAIQQQINSQFKLTKSTADHTDIVMAGDIVLLQKDGLVMNSSVCPYAGSNTYNDGVLSANLTNRAKDAAKNAAKNYVKAWGLSKLGLGGGPNVADALNNGCANRKFVAGEKFWVTGVTAKSDSILVSTFSDPYNDVRFYGEIKFPYVKGSVTQGADFLKSVAEVLTVVQPEGQADQGNPPAQDAAPAPAPAPEAAPAPAPIQAIAPPPPPPDQPPPAIDLGQTKDQVIASSGQPLRVANLGAKTIFYYKDMKVTFMNGKVSNVE